MLAKKTPSKKIVEKKSEDGKVPRHHRRRS